MSSIITQGFGVRRESIISKGYARRIEEIVVDAIESVFRTPVKGSSSFKKDVIYQEDRCEEYTIIASLSSVNNQKNLPSIQNEITKIICNDDSVSINVKNVDVTLSPQKDNIKVKVLLKKS